jgi:hypothetical protein
MREKNNPHGFFLAEPLMEEVCCLRNGGEMKNSETSSSFVRDFFSSE